MIKLIKQSEPYWSNWNNQIWMIRYQLKIHKNPADSEMINHQTQNQMSGKNMVLHSQKSNVEYSDN